MYGRWQESSLEEAMKSRRVILLTGPRQCGKTTLAKSQAGKDVIYRTLDDQEHLHTALLDPHGFVQHTGSCMIIDEIQLAPALLSAIKKNVDENTRPGQYLLTGSANIQSLPSVRESLAGRISKIRLRPFSQGELSRVSASFLEMSFKQQFSSGIKKLEDRQSILHRAYTGGFPEAITLKASQQRRWYNDYIHAILDRDLKELINIRRQDSLRELLRVLAGWSGNLWLSAILVGA
jgi:predicted AAA+ superfamily ATPase